MGIVSRLTNAQYELSDRLTFFLCQKRPGNLQFLNAKAVLDIAFAPPPLCPCTQVIAGQLLLVLIEAVTKVPGEVLECDSQIL
jgi:hypothetical protein